MRQPDDMSEEEHLYWEQMCEEHCHCGMALVDHAQSATCNYAIPMTRPDMAPPEYRRQQKGLDRP